ncbi:tyrosine-protein phosphatase non-receptor type 22 isoform X3 [Myripristis murdjan]|uniref:tyrosine-protein phosphatase non-receptor type 22 isoform X3 n=1 Tax=Myripristis murdjan TaxID=586833 RepID=UPI001175F22C|nr:tyrosine-protein phosphatase non-receptor type 22-like isoform X3 [Myripristis murdjan]
MDQQTLILRSLLAQLETKEAADDGTENSLAVEFLRLKMQSTKYRTDKTYPSKEAEKQENIKKNRYKDIIPFDHSRVKLTLTTSKNDSDYINASFIKGVSGSRAYIATQGPLPHTVLDFWRMLWEYSIEVIVMSCREFEMGKKKCERYWPEKQGEPFVCGPFTVYCDSEENKGEYLTRTLRVTYHSHSRTLHQLHYVNWPDHGVPDSIAPILEMLQDMRSYQDHDDIPLCIHCSAGCGRTGALCVIDYTWNLVKSQMVPEDFSIFSLVQDMRTQRPSVVQTKEQYELVCRTIKFLFERYLRTAEVQTSRNEVPVFPSSVTATSETELSDLSEVLEYDIRLRPEIQHIAHLESQERFPLVEVHGQTSNHVAPLRMPALAVEGGDLLQHHQHLCQTFPEVLHPTDGQEGPCLTNELTSTHPTALEHTNHRAPGLVERIAEGDDIPPPKPPLLPVATICLTVEDPYFDSPVGSPSLEVAQSGSSEDVALISPLTTNPVLITPIVTLNDQTLELKPPASATDVTHSDDSIPPLLPIRTPESYILAVDPEVSEPFDRLAVIIPPNAAAEALREMGGSPPSPVPPLPERTPESYELAIDAAPVEQMHEITPAVNLNRIGTSLEWSCTSAQVDATTQMEKKSWMRSKSLKVKMSLSAPSHLTSASNATLNLPPPPNPPPPHQLTPPLSSQADESLTPPLPDRTPESFILATEEEPTENSAPSQVAQSSPMIGISSEWAGTSQPKKFLDVVMNRSKSVRARSSRQEPLTAFQQLSPPPVVMAGGGSEGGQHDANHTPSLRTQTSENRSDESSGKVMSRTKSLKFFRHKVKPKTAPQPAPTQSGSPPASYSASTSVFKFGFGNRFGKPKGPRSHPETWV